MFVRTQKNFFDRNLVLLSAFTDEELTYFWPINSLDFHRIFNVIFWLLTLNFICLLSATFQALTDEELTYFWPIFDHLEAQEMNYPAFEQ